MELIKGEMEVKEIGPSPPSDAGSMFQDIGDSSCPRRIGVKRLAKQFPSWSHLAANLQHVRKSMQKGAPKIGKASSKERSPNENILPVVRNSYHLLAELGSWRRSGWTGHECGKRASLLPSDAKSLGRFRS
jgi:hypothetical protein